MAHTYINSESGLWTVGTYDGGRWEAESDHDTPEKAAAHVHYLNGGNPAYDLLVDALKEARIATRELCEGQDPKNECWAILGRIDAALAAAGAA